MLGIIEIEGKSPKQSVVKKTTTYEGGFLYIKFKIENEEDFGLLFDIFWIYMSDWFGGFSEFPKYINDKAVVNKEQTIYYDYQKNEIDII
jgi:hypothetical protein